MVGLDTREYLMRHHFGLFVCQNPTREEGKSDVAFAYLPVGERFARTSCPVHI